MRGEIEKMGKKELRERLLAEKARSAKMSEEIKNLRERAEKEDEVISEAGSLAEAAMALSGIFSAADKAAGRYVDSVERLNTRVEAACVARDELSKKQAEQTLTEARRRAEELLTEAVEKSKKMLSDAAKKSEELISAAKKRADDYYAETKEKADAYVKAKTDLRDAISR